MNRTLVLPSAFPPRPTLYVLLLLAASANPVFAGPTVRLVAAKEAEVADVRAVRASGAPKASRKATVPATVTWVRSEPKYTVFDDTSSLIWRNKGTLALGTAGYIAATQPEETLDGLANLVHGSPDPASAESKDRNNHSEGLLSGATMLGWLLQSTAPYAIAVLAGVLVLPLLRLLLGARAK
ncbi:MAG: hypothetical protein IT462_15280 [Planctomycetes bacterium]|nr:hypothetical protein [Planctomycetota bacterium]